MTDWAKIQKEFDNLTDINEIFVYLRTKASELEVCESIECKLFPNLSKLGKKRKNFEYKSLEEAEKELPKNHFLKFKRKFFSYYSDAETVFSELYALDVAHKAKAKLHKQHHEEFLQTLTKINDNDYAMPTQVGDEINNKLSEISVNAIPTEKRAKQFQAFKEKLDKKEKAAKKKAKKPKVEVEA